MAPSGLSIWKETIISTGENSPSRGSADAKEEAFEKAMKYVKPNKIIEKKPAYTAKNESILMKAPNKNAARELIAKKADGYMNSFSCFMNQNSEMQDHISIFAA